MEWMPEIHFSATNEYGLVINTNANNRAGLWYDAPVSNAYNFICEKYKQEINGTRTEFECSVQSVQSSPACAGRGDAVRVG